MRGPGSGRPLADSAKSSFNAWCILNRFGRHASYLLCVTHRQRKRKHAHRVHHAKVSRTPDRPDLLISGSDCPKVNNGHIVPRMYQKAWEREEDRHVAVHEAGPPDCELKSTKLAGARGPYYRRTRPRHGTATDDIEARLPTSRTKRPRRFDRCGPGRR